MYSLFIYATISCHDKVTSFIGTPLEGTATVNIVCKLISLYLDILKLLITGDINSPCNEFHDVVITDKDGVYQFRGLQV